MCDTEVQHKNTYTYRNETGDAVVTVYDVFPGVQVAYHDVHMERFEMSYPRKTGHFIEIHHCLEGRMEQEIGNHFLYLMPGDLSIECKDQMAQKHTFPLRHYHGITVAFNTDNVPRTFSPYLNNEFLQPVRMAGRLCGAENCVVLRSEPYIEHIFSELYTVRESERIGYLQVKILELLYTLNMAEYPYDEVPRRTLPRSQVSLAKQAALYIMEHMDKKLKISEIAVHFSVSESYLKNVFKGVYGVAVSSYMRIQKMQCAAQVLSATNRPIADIAAEFGYVNDSKFSAAFRDVMGETPKEWRRIHANINIM